MLKYLEKNTNINAYAGTIIFNMKDISFIAKIPIAPPTSPMLLYLMNIIERKSTKA